MIYYAVLILGILFLWVPAFGLWTELDDSDASMSLVCALLMSGGGILIGYALAHILSAAGA